MTGAIRLPDWAEPLYTADEMRAIDHWAIETNGVPSIELMELAGTAIAHAALEPAPAGPIVIVAGKGNNGGDGLVAARRLREVPDRLGDKRVEVALLCDPEELAGDARSNFERLPGDPVRQFDGALIASAGVIVDAMLGTGATGAPRGIHGEAVTAINRRGGAARVIAVDIPTGVNATTGAVAGDAVDADLTISLHGPKIGQVVAPGLFHCGELRVAEIGIPELAAVQADVSPSVGAIGAHVLRRVPGRLDSGTKFSSGVLSVIGGSTGLTGAPCLAVLAAQRSGAGYVTAMVPASLNTIFEQRLLEAMSLPLPDAEGAIGVDALEIVLERSAQSDALIVGPGIGRAEQSSVFVRELLERSDKPVVLDADGLWAFRGAIDLLKARHAPTVLTPHSGELGRLLSLDSDAVDASRIEVAREAAARSGAVVVLKGSDTIVARPGGPAVVNVLRAPGLATAGTGDVLSGVIGAFLAKAMDPFEAAAAGVYAHALAGREASGRHGANQMIASDVIEALPDVLG